MSEEFRKKIREMCTYHSDDGTSGYLLSEEQFNQILSLFSQTVKEQIIGEDEKIELEEVEVGDPGSTVYDVTEDLCKTRNYLRVEQRANLLSVVGGK